jgi:hypothetical protein
MFLEIAKRSAPTPISVSVKPLEALDPRMFSDAGSTEGAARGQMMGGAAIAEGISSAGKSVMGGVAKNVDVASDAANMAMRKSIADTQARIDAAKAHEMGQYNMVRSGQTDRRLDIDERYKNFKMNPDAESSNPFAVDWLRGNVGVGGRK